MARIIILISFAIALNSCSIRLNCDIKSPNPDYKSDVIRIQKLRVLKNKLSFEMANLSDDYLYLPLPLTIGHDVNTGNWFLNNDVFSTSVGISIDLAEIKPKSKYKFSLPITEKYRKSYDEMKIHMLFAKSNKPVMMKDEITNISFLEFYDQYINEVFWVLENCD